MRKALAAAAAFGTIAAMSFIAAPAATADTGDGDITVTVVEDVNHDGVRDGGDPVLDGSVVRITDADGNVVTRTVTGGGAVTVLADDADNTLVGGAYRIDVTSPNDTQYTDATIVDDREDPDFAPTTSFVDVTGGPADVSVGFVDVTAINTTNPTLYSAIQPDSIWPGNTETKEIYSIDSKFTTPATGVTTRLTTGSVYGIGVDQFTGDIYAGAYAKRGSAYGPGGPGAIYRVDPDTGATAVYATVADAGTTAHDMTTLQDYAFRTVVGRESLGDVEVTDDGRFLLAMNMHTDSIVVYPVQDAVDPAPIQTEQIPAQNDCAADWAPMAITEHDGHIYVGAVCGATSEAFVLEYSMSAGGVLSATGNVLTGDPTTAPGHSAVNGPNLGVDASCELVDWRAWTDDVPQDCLDKSAYTSPPDPALAGIPGQFTVPQPMLSDIEFTSTGKMVLAFRDRGGDLYGSILYSGERTDGDGAWTDYIAQGDVVTTCIEGTTIDFTCTGDYNDYGGLHNESAFGGMVLIPGENERLVINEMDATELYSNGLRAFDPETGQYADASTGGGNALATKSFRKSQGLADIEAYVEHVAQQIGNRVWIDTDRDGVQDPGEPAVEGVQVSLYDADGNLVSTTETDANGEYYFDTADGVEPNTDYEIRLDRAADFEPGGPLSGMAPTLQDAGSDDGIDNDGALGDVDGTQVVLADITSPDVSHNDHSFDFGFVPQVSIGDYVWIDANHDGVQDDDEQPVPGVTVTLDGPDGTVTTTTDENGYYSFADLEPSTDYTVTFPTTVTVDGVDYPLTDADQGGDDAADSDADASTGAVTVTTPASGDNLTGPDQADDPTIDAGYTPPLVSIGDYVWIDEDGDGQQGADETPVPGATVTLTDSNGDVVATTTTDDEGFYAFTDLPASTDYTVTFPTTVTVDGDVYALTGQGTDQASNSDSNADPATGEAPVTTPADGDNLGGHGQADDPSIDAGYVKQVVSIGDYVWIDTDRDGVQDADESPVPGATVALTDENGDVVATTTTDENGYYAFTDLKPSTDYTVTFPTTVTVDGAEYPLTDADQGGDDAADSDPDSSGSVSVTTPASGDNSAEPGEADDPTIDAGYVPPLVSIGDYVWLDADRDGVQDAGETPVPGAEVNLLNSDGDVVATTTTDENGYYAFTDLEPSTDYVVQFPKTVTVDGVTTSLTGQTQGGDAAADSNADVSSGLAPVTTPASGNNSAEPGQADDPTIDAGYVKPLVSVGDYVWLDEDGDGVQDEGETPLPGVTVTLTDENGDVVATTTTDEDGYYAFTDLEPGTEYTIEFPTSVDVDGQGYPLTSPNAGGDAGADSNPAPSTGRTTFTTPLSGDNSAEPGEADDPTIDAGYVEPEVPLVSVGDYVWMDEDGDGVQDDGETPLSGVEVKLFDGDGNLVTSTTTDEHGFYVFTNLTPSAEYTITFPTEVTIDGVTYPLTEPGQGSNRGADSNADASTGSFTFTAPASGNNSAEPGMADDPTIDAGFTPVPDPILPVTGGTIAWMAALWAILLVGIGGGLILIRRRNPLRNMTID